MRNMLAAVLLANLAYAQVCTNCISQNDGEVYEVGFVIEPIDKTFEHVKSLTVKNKGKVVQTLNVHKNIQWFPKDHAHYIVVEDFDFDGHKDFAFMTVNAINRSYDYYLFSKDQKKFTYVGNHPEFKLDKKKKRLTAFIKDGPKRVTKVFKIQKGVFILKSSKSETP
jgi:hypothetical protein